MQNKRHPRFNLLSLLFLVFVLLVSCTAKPSISIDISGLNIQKDSIRTFVIYNRGKGKLIILDFVTSCECIALDLTKGKAIEPKDSLKVQLKINPKDQDADNMIYVTLKTNATPQLTSFHFRP